MGVQEKCAPPHCIASQVPMVYPAYITHCSCLFVTSEHSPVPAQADDLQPVHLLRMFAQSLLSSFRMAATAYIAGSKGFTVLFTCAELPRSSWKCPAPRRTRQLSIIWDN